MNNFLPVVARLILLVAVLFHTSVGIRSKPTVVDFKSLVEYKKIHGDLLVPRKFAFDQHSSGKLGFAAHRLGEHVKLLRKQAKLTAKKNIDTRNMISPEDRNKLDEMGFAWSASEESFMRTLRGLVAYKDIYNDFIVPASFVIPDGDPRWSRELWGLKLGSRLHHLRQNKKMSKARRDTLNTMGITLDTTRDLEGEKIRRALQVYKLLHDGNLDVPFYFIIPEGDERWPTNLWGMKLGIKVKRIVYYEAYPQFHDEFKKLGLASGSRRLGDVGTIRDREGEKIKEALQVYKLLHDGNLDVPRSYIIPEGDVRWPKPSWGMKLGSRVQAIVYSGNYPQFHDEFKRLGLASGSTQLGMAEMKINSRKLWFEGQKIKKALQVYKMLHNGDLHVPKSFIIPEGDQKWPKSLWGMKLGGRVGSIVYKGSYPTFHPEFKKLGLASGPRKLGDVRTIRGRGGENIKMALQVYKALHDGNLNVPQSFIIPEGDEKWPKSIWGMKLGIRVRNIVCHGGFPQFHDEFKKLGLASGSRRLGDVGTINDREGEKVKKALQVYKKLHDGNLNVPLSFIIPEGDTKWPKSLWGMQLGTRVSNIVYRGSYPTFHPEFKKLGLASGPRKLGEIGTIQDVKGEKIIKALRMYKALHSGNLNVPFYFIIPEGDEKWPTDLWGMKLGFRVSDIVYKKTYPQFHDEFKKLGLASGSRRLGDVGTIHHSSEKK